MDVLNAQLAVCKSLNAVFTETPGSAILGASLNIKAGIYPINGLRHPVEDNTSGWYIWAGEYSADPNFFEPVHTRHLEEWCPEIIKYLGLPPGWRFQFAPDYEDIWLDESLLEM